MRRTSTELAQDLKHSKTGLTEDPYFTDPGLKINTPPQALPAFAWPPAASPLPQGHPTRSQPRETLGGWVQRSPTA